MEVIIYDGPPSIGTTLWVKDKIGSNVLPSAEVITNFTRVKAKMGLSFPDKAALAEAQIDFLSLIDEARNGGKETIIFDGSPITLVALEHLMTGGISTKSRKAAIRYIGGIREKLNIVLLKPLPGFIGVDNMRCFDSTKVIPFGNSLEIAYREAGCDPTIVEMKKSPYSSTHFHHSYGRSFQRHIHSPSISGD